jgi:hypothetical protein
MAGWPLVLPSQRWAMRGLARGMPGTFLCLRVARAHPSSLLRRGTHGVQGSRQLSAGMDVESLALRGRKGLDPTEEGHEQAVDGRETNLLLRFDPASPPARQPASPPARRMVKPLADCSV